MPEASVHEHRALSSRLHPGDERVGLASPSRRPRVALAGDAAGTGQPLGEHDGDAHGRAAVVSVRA